MRFREYAENRETDLLIERCALIASQSDMDIDVFIENFIKEQGLSEDWNSFVAGAKDTAKWAWDKVKNFAPVKAGTQALNRVLDDRHRKAVNSLKDLQQFLANNEQAKGILSKNKSNMSVTDYIGELVKSLERESGISRLANGVEAAGSNKAPDMAAKMKQWQDGQSASGQPVSSGNAPTQTAPVTYGTQPHLLARRGRSPKTNATSVVSSNSGSGGS